MKKLLILFALNLIILTTATAQVEAISYEDSTSAIDTINEKLRGWHCTPLKIEYVGSSAEDLEYLNSLKRGKFTDCMVFKSDFHTPRAEDNQTTFEPDTDYKDWTWYFGLNGDKWELVTYGY